MGLKSVLSSDDDIRDLQNNTTVTCGNKVYIILNNVN